MNGSTSWPAAVVALGFLAFAAVVFVTVYPKGGIDDTIKAWRIIGPIIGVVIGTIPTFFFNKVAQQAQRDANALRLAADEPTIARARTFGLRAG